ncbi:DnaJ C-terminal domain-containing protein [Brevundimonas sp. NIBR11]|uniref:DnaJ C-terminal domain-containing protein n=1 Tax=Brevundimonas sp. NIBR11 TaxID=3015999 RepID=UPI0022F126A6|nr:DnaJ C-terminal domain-containing protein [Brevundimonas sp. NIBR11]WGM30270.1 Curved DNA-binding protein [Brevundimonas sp. NIBR11]
MAGDPYKELGVSRGASAADIKAAFRKLAKELHPDKNRGDTATEERFKRVSAAFDLLNDPDKKSKYDSGQIDADGQPQYRGFGGQSAGAAGMGTGGFGGFGAGGPGGPGGRAAFEDLDLDDIFGRFGGGGRGRAAGFGRGQDVRATLEISLEDSIGGATRRIQFSDGRTLDVAIPKGATNGQTIRLRGQGTAGRTEPGDALIELRIAPHPVFKVDGADLTMDLAISIPDAILGGKVECPTPDGTVSVTVPKGSNSGQTLRLKGRGAFAGGARGDLKARLILTLPDTIDPILERVAEDWRANRPYKPGKG